MKTTLASALALAATLAIGPAMAQSADSANNSSAAGGLPAECQMLGPALDQAAIDRIQDLDERRQALSCMVGTPRDYQAELDSRPSGGEISAIDIEQSWGSDTVAEGLEQSAEANAAATGDLQTALSADQEISSYLEAEGIDVADIVGYVIGPNGNTTLIIAPSTSDQTATGSTSGGMAGDTDAMSGESSTDSTSN